MVIMTSLSNPSNRRFRGGFTFVEILVAASILVLFAGSALAALTQFNRYANASRLKSHAVSLAQQRLDAILTTQWRANATRPTILNAGTVTESNLVMNADAKNSVVGLKSDFTALAAPHTCTRTTVITNLTTRMVRASVTVSFLYAGRTYSVNLTTIRATDTI